MATSLGGQFTTGLKDRDLNATLLRHPPNQSTLPLLAVWLLQCFWLMVEGGDIDWGIHDNNLDNIIGTVLDFDKAVGVAAKWIERNGGWKKNVLIVTADHDHYLTLYPNFPQLVKTKGAKTLTYGSETDSASVGHSFGSIPEDKYGWGNHTRRPVPVYYQGQPFKLDKYISKGFKAYGFDVPGVANAVDQVHIYKAMYEAITGQQPQERS